MNLFLNMIVFSIIIIGANNICNHPIFCSNIILEAVSKSNYFDDSKTFVDLILKVPVQVALNNFKTKTIENFITESFFDDPNIIFQNVTFSDYNENASFLNQINNIELKAFAKQLHSRWNLLGKKVVLEKSNLNSSCLFNCSSFIQELDNKILIFPGGRFREAYYWDTYWIILGLITSDMLQTAIQLIDNFAIVVNKFGFVPNGMRQYYLNRSQPPFLFLMVKKIVQALYKKGETQKAHSLQQKFYEILLKQNDYWQKTHSKTINISNINFQVNQYRANTKNPRPESYRQDMITVSQIDDQSIKNNVLSCISSMAQSGWDFSSRWLQSQQLTSTIIDQIIPSDLNTLLGMQQAYLATLSSKFHREDLMILFLRKLQERHKFFQMVKKNGRFPDYNLKYPLRQQQSIYPSDFLPYLLFPEDINIDNYFKDKINPSSSKIKSGQQWDSPNVWAPNNWILHEIASDSAAERIAKEWIKTTYCGYKKSGNIYQKYRNDEFGERGQGGQYKVQTGFGWTNGLTVYYLNLYGQNFQISQC